MQHVHLVGHPSTPPTPHPPLQMHTLTTSTTLGPQPCPPPRPQTLLDLTPVFAPPTASGPAEPTSLEAAACFLRLVYCPQEVHPDSFAALSAAGWLVGTARLAHRLDAARLLQGLEAYIRGEGR